MASTTITGPVTGGRHGWPFGSAARDLTAEGYLEEEFFLAGAATRYRPAGDLGGDGRWAIEPAGSTPFVTRMLIRRPADPSRFNGTVVVEWNNVSAGCEIFEEGDTSVIFDEGFAFAGVSAQRVGVHGHEHNPQGLRAWDPERYGDLHVDDDAISYGVFSEAGRALAPGRDRAGVDPLAGLAVERLLAVGGSQSAGRLATYVNAVHPIDPVYDGYILFTWFGNGTSVDDPATLNIQSAGGSRFFATSTRIRDDLDVPVMVVNSECEATSMLPARQPDTDRFRFWEVAGAAHGPALHMQRIGAKMVRDQVALPAPAGADRSGQPGPVPFAAVLDAAIDHTNRWIAGGPPPPVQPRIEFEGEPPHIHRDADGNAVGGIRVPEMEATLTRNIGDLAESGAGGLTGLTTPLPADVVRARYPDQEAYLKAFGDATDRAVAAGVLLPRDAREGLERAATVALP